MVTRTYDVKLLVDDGSDFSVGNSILGNSSATYASIVAVEDNTIKVRLNNVLQEFSSSEEIHSNSVVFSESNSGQLNDGLVPFVSNSYSSETTTAAATISSIEYNRFTTAKNADTQNPIVRLVSIYYPGEWYPPNDYGNPSGVGEGRAWPNGFPIQLAQVVGATNEDIDYNVIFDSNDFTPAPINISGIDQAADGKINELTFELYNIGNIISALVENPYLSGNNISNATVALVNGEYLHGIDPRTVDADPADVGTVGDEAYDTLTRARANGLSYDASVVSLYGMANAAFTYEQTQDVNGTWRNDTFDSRDLLGAVVNIKTTFAQFLDYWPEYSIITDVSDRIITVKNSAPYRVGDNVIAQGSSVESTITSISPDNKLQLSGSLSVDDSEYNGNSLDVSSQTTSPRGVVFNSDGTKAYVAGSEIIYQYSLPVPYSISSAIYEDISYATSAQAIGLRSIIFNDIGNKMYVPTYAGVIYQYSLAEPFDVSTANYDDVSLDVSNEETNLFSVAINNDGTKIFITGNSSDRVHEYALTTAFNLDTASYSSVSFLVSQTPNPVGLAFNYDGSKMYILSAGADIFQYSLSSNFDVSTAQYDSLLFDASTQAAVARGIIFNNTSNKMYITDEDSDTVFEYDILYPSLEGISADVPLYIVNEEADSESYVEDTFKIDQLESLSDQVASFGLVSWLQYFKLVLPRRRYYKNTCQWQYKGDECQYPSDGASVIPGTAPELTANGFFTISNEPTADPSLDACSKSFKACELRRNTIHYGAYPGTGRSVPKA